MSFPQVKYPYNPKIGMGFWKDTPIRISVWASQKRPHTQPLSTLPLLGRIRKRKVAGTFTRTAAE